MAKKEKEASSFIVDPNMDSHLSFLQEALQKEFGEDSALSLGSPKALSRIDHWVSTRSIVVDKVLLGGRVAPASLVPVGRVTEIAGKEGVGKSTLVAQIMAETQAQGGLVIVTDTESRIDAQYFTALGVDLSKVLSIYADNTEDVFRKQIAAIKIMQKNAPNQILTMIWDSIGGTSSAKSLADGEDPMDQAAYGADAKVNSHGIKVVNTMIAKSKISYIFTNHVYQKMNVKWGDDQETSGGSKLKYFATVRLRLSEIGAISEKDDNDRPQRSGKRIRVKAIKNSMSPICLEKDAVIIGGKGFCNEYTVMENAETIGLIKKAGPWSTWIAPISGEVIKFLGFAGFMDKVAIHPEYKNLEQMVFEAL